MSQPQFNPVVVAPTYNNARTLASVLAGVQAAGFPVIVVNDGSTDGTADILAQFGNDPHIKIFVHPRNRGKAAALQTAFTAAADLGHTHAATIDTDGQHEPAELAKVISRARETPDALVLGLRDEQVPGYPAKSKLGRRLSNLFIRMESGVRVDDSQCGMRVYPLRLVQVARCAATRYGFETEIVTRAGWAGCPVIEVPVACCYLPAGERVSHLHPVIDTFRAIGMHARLLARAMLPWPRHVTLSGAALSEKAEKKRSPVRQLLDWLNPVEAWRAVRRDQVSREHFAAGLAVGAFIGNLPTYGLHAVLGLYTARRLHLHPVAVVIGTHISTPPVGAFLNAAAIAVGHVILHGSLPSITAYDLRTLGFLEVLRRMLVEWLIGSPIVGFGCAIAVFMVSRRLLYLAAMREEAAPPALTGAALRDTPTSPATRPDGSAAGHAV